MFIQILPNEEPSFTEKSLFNFYGKEFHQSLNGKNDYFSKRDTGN
jgi:hypothetical protein